VTATRRSFLTSSAAAGLSLGVAPYGFARQRRVLRVLGTHVTLQEPLRRQAQKDLGIEIRFERGGSASVLHQAATRPESFDLYEQWSNSVKILWQAGAIQPIDTNRLTYWDEINNLTKTGKLTPQANLGAGALRTNYCLFSETTVLAPIQPDGSVFCRTFTTSIPSDTTPP